MPERSKWRILHVYPYYYTVEGTGGGGVRTALLNLVEGLDKQRYQVLVLTPAPSPLDARLLRAGASDVLSLDYPGHLILQRSELTPLGLMRYGWRLWRQIRQIERIIREHGIDLVHSHVSAFLGAVLAAKRTRTPSLLHIREFGFRLPGWLNGIYLRFIPRCTDRIVCVARFIAEAFLRAGAPPDKIVTIYNEVNLDRFSLSGRRDLREELGIPSGTPVVGFVGRIAPRKGLDYFIQAAALIRQQVNDVKFLIVGEADEDYEQQYKTDLLRLCSQLGVSDIVIFAGARSDIPDVLYTMDVLVFPSPVDIGPHVPLEAMAMACPVVTASLGGAQEEVEDGVTGIHANPQDPENIAQATVSILRDRVLAERLGAQGRARAEKMFGLERYIREIEGVYMALVDVQGGNPH